jgi:hypothetical protein
VLRLLVLWNDTCYIRKPRVMGIYIVLLHHVCCHETGELLLLVCRGVHACKHERRLPRHIYVSLHQSRSGTRICMFPAVGGMPFVENRASERG